MRPERDSNAVRRRLARLAEMVQAVEQRGSGKAGQRVRSVVATGWPDVDNTLVSPFYGESVAVTNAGQAAPGGLMRGAVHEWLGGANVETSRRQNVKMKRGDGGGSGWAPALCVLGHLAWRALVWDEEEDSQGGADAERMWGGGYAVWIGRAVWPYPRVLLRGSGLGRASEPGCFGGMTASVRDRLLLERSLFIDPPDDAMRLWAIDLALRCPAITAVIADGSRLRMAQTRRLQLAAEAGGDRSSGGALALLARPPDERGELSAAATRWSVTPAPSPTARPRWTIELLRCKGMGGPSREVKPEREINGRAAGTSRLNTPEPAAEDPQKARSEPKAGTRTWMLEWDHAKGVVAVPADVVDRPDQATETIEEYRDARAGPARRSA